GNKKKLTWWQDEFWKHMVKKYPELERGESASQTGRDHIPPRVFKEMTRLNKQREKLDGLLTGMTHLNMKSRTEEICKLLDSYIPGVEKMQTQLNKYSTAFTDTVTENKKLKKKNAPLSQSLDKASEESTLKKIADARLKSDYEEAIAVLDRIPKEVLDSYTKTGSTKSRRKER
ncbi:MAG: plasmid recombination protein, partial [Clostridiales bacterium]|nr:plasmid recombination protein [Clostridiales bacterium]